MELFSIAIVLLIVFLSTCLATTILSDSDILTFISCYIGKQPGDAFKGKVVWITGASSGIGEGIAKELAKSCESAKIVISARREDELKRVKRECLQSNPARSENSVLVLPLDMTDYSSHEPALNKIIQTYGKLDVLVSNAGRSQRAKWHEIEPQVDKELFELNVFSLVNMNRVVLRHYFKVGGGHLAVISSIAGKIGAPNSGSYTGSKHALHGYFESLRNEVRKQNIRITMICPGPVFSGVLKEAFTAKPGQKVDQEHSPNDRRMTSERCGYLTLVAIGNQLEESWVSPFPIVFVTYLSAYLPFVFSKVMALVNSSETAMQLRDSRNVMKEESKSK